MVKTGSPWRKNNLRELKRTIGRFLAIFAIVALGVGFFAGLKLARPAMVNIGREFVAQSRFYDYQLISSIGLTEEDRAFFASMDGIAAAEGSVSADLLTEAEGKQVVFKTHQLLETLNQVQLTAGRMPQAPNECLLDDLNRGEEAIGTVFSVDNEDGHSFSQDSYTVVGLCNTAQYLNIQRGTTSLGDGTVAGFLFLPAEGYDSEVFTEIYVDIEEPYDAFTEEYDGLMDDWEQPLTDAMEQRGELRREQVWQDAQNELDEAWAEYEDGRAEYNEARAEVDAELADAKAELEQAEQDLAHGRKELEEAEALLAEMEIDPFANEELADARKQLDDGWAQLWEGEAEYQKGRKEFEEKKAEALPQLQDAKKQLDDAKKELEAGWEEYWDGFRQLEDSKRTMQVTLSPLQRSIDETGREAEDAWQDLFRKEQTLAGLQKDPEADPLAVAAAAAAVQTAAAEAAARQAAYTAAQTLYEETLRPLTEKMEDGEKQLEEGRTQLVDGQRQYEEGLQQYEEGLQQLEDGEQQLKDAEAQMASARRQLENGEQELKEGIETAMTEGRKAVADGWKELADGEEQLADGWKEYEEGAAEADAEFADAKAELDDAERELEEAQEMVDLLKDPSYYALNRRANAGYASFDNDTMIVANVAEVFPVFFFLVAALVCSSTMTRMVEEQRLENGTLKALGFTDGQIMWRYASYAGSAALLGFAVGYLLCGWLFPYVIWHAYKMLYHFGEIKLLLDGKLALISLFFALLSSVGAACAAAWSEMRQMPAQLMRPKAPKAGKRIFLEYITPLWKRLGFLHKVAARNIFRYKKRMIMMVLGVGGCMALLIAGLGMRDSISTVADDQFGRIMRYDYSITFSDEQSPEEQAAFREEMGDVLSHCAFVRMEAADAFTGSGMKSVSIIATDDPEILHAVDLHQGETALGYPEGDGAYISSKLAALAGVKAGDTLRLQLENKELAELPVTGVFDNYVNHFIFLTGEGYRTHLDDTLDYTAALALTEEKDIHSAAVQVQKAAGVVNVSVSQDFRDMVSDTLVSLDAVVLLIVACAVALSLVVSYNLCNINITERQREIATIKVLGFYPRETKDYVFRESVVLTFMGVVVGIPLGIWLHSFVLNQINVDMVSFRARISLFSFVLAVVITFAINGLVDLLLQGKIDQIHMAESLKSVE